MTSRWFLGLTFLASFVGFTPTAHAAESTVHMRWNAPDECPDDLELVRAVEGFLGRPLEPTRDRPLTVNVNVQGDAERGYAAKLSFTADSGVTERVLDHADCGKLSEGAALLIALTIDPEAVKARQEAAEAKPATSVAPAPAEPPAPAKAPPAPASQPVTPAPASATPSDRDAPPTKDRSKLEPRLAVTGLLGAGMLPSLAPGLSAELGLRWRLVELAANGRYWLSQAADVPGVAGSSVDMSLVTAGLRLSAVPSWGPFTLQASLRGDLGNMTGSGEGVNNSRPQGALFAALGGGLAGAYALGRLSPIVGMDLLWAATRPRFGVLQDDQQLQAFRPKTWQLLGYLGLSYAL